MGGTFLLIGILLSVLSRWLEFEDNSTLGDVNFKEWWDDRSTRKKAFFFVIFAAVGILCLQAAF